MPTKVFISYRRDDSKYQARGVYAAFQQVLPREDLFMDIDSIPPGADFVNVLEGWVDQCDILLALIGSGWASANDPKTGRRRLENPNDFVRIELREALARNIPVVPVLLDGAPMPNLDDLPDDIKTLVRRQAEFVEYRTFDADINRLIKKLGLSNDLALGVERPPGGDGQQQVQSPELPPPVSEGKGRDLFVDDTIAKLSDFSFQGSRSARMLLEARFSGLSDAEQERIIRHVQEKMKHPEAIWWRLGIEPLLVEMASPTVRQRMFAAIK